MLLNKNNTSCKMKEVVILVCSFCKSTFDSKDDIACHMLNDHGSNETVKKLRKQLTIHNTKTTKIRPKDPVQKQRKSAGQEPKVKTYGTEFYCDMCDYKTVYRSTYKRHLLIHETGGRQHKCQYCSYSAIQPHNLKVHLKSVHPFGAVEPVIIQ